MEALPPMSANRLNGSGDTGVDVLQGESGQLQLFVTSAERTQTPASPETVAHHLRICRAALDAAAHKAS